VVGSHQKIAGSASHFQHLMPYSIAS
jgi:hypothetical protein